MDRFLLVSLTHISFQQQMDANSDGVVDEDEFVEFCMRVGFPADFACSIYFK